MPRPSYSLAKVKAAYLEELRQARRSERTLRLYDYTLTTAFQALEEAGRTGNPRQVRPEDVDYLSDVIMAGAAPRYKVNVAWTIVSFCKWAGNEYLKRYKVSFGSIPSTERVRWLENEQAMALKLEARDLERMIVHCELDLGMRRIELLRLRPSDFQTTRSKREVHLLGKGRNGGKPRSIPWHPDTANMLKECLDRRDAEIRRARAKSPGVPVPEQLLIYERGGRLFPYRKSAIEKVLNGLGERMGFHFSNHDLRRTCGRMMYRSGVPIEVIAKIFGHSDTRTTMHYLGLDYEDMSGAMSTYAQYQKSFDVPKIGTFDESQEMSGQGGI